MNRKIIVTGAAGFIGHHFCMHLADRDVKITGVDNFDPFYDRDIKEMNLNHVRDHLSDRRAGFNFREMDILNRSKLAELFEEIDPDAVVHFAAVAGVRRSRERPIEYLETNVTGTGLLMEQAVQADVDKFVFISSSSVYGNHDEYPFSEEARDLEPISPYGATKRSAELYCRTYHEHFDLPLVVIRPFTVYGPRQRPDMAIHKFSRLISAGEPLPFFGDGTTERDYTYVTDIVNGVESAMDWEEDWGLFNLGGSRSITLDRLVELLGKAFGKEPEIDRQPLPPGDVTRTKADISNAKKHLDYQPDVPVEEGIEKFVTWFQNAPDAVK